MKKLFVIGALIIVMTVIFSGCTNRNEADNSQDQEVTKKINQIEDEQMLEKRPLDDKTEKDLSGEGNQVGLSNEKNQDKTDEVIKEDEAYYSPFTGEPVQELNLKKAIMVSIENSKRSRPQAGLHKASLVYEFLVEGGITRFLALYWDVIPDKIGPVRSVRPYLINTASEYNALLLHAGASPEGFEMLEDDGIDHIDQIYQGRYFWRDEERKAPHNLYTGGLRISRYLEEMTGRKYQSRFPFQQISFVQPEDTIADVIKISFWGDYTVIYRYNPERNSYFRYLYDLDHPHLDAGRDQLKARNIIIQYVATEVADDVGRLKMKLKGEGDALIFRDGLVIKGYWKNDGKSWTKYYNPKDRQIPLNPGQTWIEVVPRSTKVEYGSEEIGRDR